MTEQKQLEEIRKLREGIDNWFYNKLSVKELLRQGLGNETIQDSKEWVEANRESLLAVLSDPQYKIKIDTGELTDWEESQNALNGLVKSNPRSSVPEWLYSDTFRVMIKAVATAARARFVSIGEIAKEADK